MDGIAHARRVRVRVGLRREGMTCAVSLVRLSIFFETCEVCFMPTPFKSECEYAGLPKDGLAGSCFDPNGLLLRPNQLKLLAPDRAFAFQGRSLRTSVRRAAYRASVRTPGVLPAIWPWHTLRTCRIANSPPIAGASRACGTRPGLQPDGCPGRLPADRCTHTWGSPHFVRINFPLRVSQKQYRSPWCSITT